MTMTDLGRVIAPTFNLYEKELDIPVSIVFQIGEPHFSGPLVPTLYQLSDVAKKTISILAAAAS